MSRHGDGPHRDLLARRRRDGPGRRRRASPDELGLGARRDGDGTWGTFPGTHDAAGAVTIPDVPNGTFWLRFQAPGRRPRATYLDTAGGTTLDLGYDQLGRSTCHAPTASTPATFPLALATNWPTGNADQIQIVSSNADVWDACPRPRR